MLGVAARAACVRYAAAAGTSAVAASFAETERERHASCESAGSGLRRKMTPIGRFSLLSETAASPSVPAVLLTLGGAPLAAGELGEALTLGVVPASARFRCRVDERALEFVDDLGGGGAPAVLEGAAIGVAALPGVVAEALVAPLVGREGGGPWWEARLFPHGGGGGGKTSVLVRAHHCLADGVSLASLFSRATDQAPEIEAAVAAEVERRRRSRPKTRGPRWLRTVRRWLSALRFLASLLRGAWAMVRVALVTHAPFRGAAPRRGAAQGRSVAWRAHFSTVAELKRVAKALGGDGATVNDVFAAVVAGALRGAVDDRAVRHVTCAVPVHLYGGALVPGVDVGNHIGAVLATLPLPPAPADAADAQEAAAAHVATVSRDVGGALRGGAGAIVAYGAAYLAGACLPRAVVPSAMAASAGCATVALTNVRGPPVDALSIRGRPVETIVPFLPPPPGVPVGVALTTIGSDATISFNADASLLSADDLLAAALDYYATLQAAADARPKKPQ